MDIITQCVRCNKIMDKPHMVVLVNNDFPGRLYVCKDCFRKAKEEDDPMLAMFNTLEYPFVN